MPLLNDQLSVWEIGFRWAGRDPDSWSPRIPLPVRDNFRILMDAILQANLFCLTISLEKRGNDQEAPYLCYIRDDIDAVYDCIQGSRYPRKLLKWAGVERWAMQDWCERQGIPLPEFWFPPGWKIDYVWPYSDEDENAPEPQPTDAQAEKTPGSPVQSFGESGSPAPPVETPAHSMPPTMSDNEAEGRQKLDQRQRRKVACQEAAKYVWGKHPDWDVKAVANSPEVQEVAGGKESDFDVLLRWLGEVDPRDPGKRRGPKRKK